MNLGRPLPARCPQTGRDHELPDRFLGQQNIVTLAQLLAGKSWPEIAVALLDDRHGAYRDACVDPVIARLGAST